MTDDRRWTYGELWDKIEWEGGVEEALRWGVLPTQVPRDLEFIWTDLSQKFYSYESVATYVSDVIEREVRRESTESAQ